MTQLLAANGEPLEWATNATVDNFVRADGDLAGWQQRRSGGVQWHDAFETDTVRFDAWEIDTNLLVAPGTVRDTWGPTDPTIAAGYPLDGNGDPYSPWIVSHRLAWVDIGQTDEYEVEVAWDVDDEKGAVVQLSPVIAVDIDATGSESGLLPAWDISIFGGVTYWHVVPMTTSVSDVFDPDYYHAVPGTGVALTTPAVGRHWWRVRCTGGTYQAWFDGEDRGGPYARPAWSTSRTTIGVHVVGIHCDTAEVYPPGLGAWTGTPAVNPAPVASSPRWQWQSIA